MKRLLVLTPLLLLAVLALTGCGSSAERLNNDGNEAFAEQDYEGALMAYHQAEEESPELAEPHYNAANTHYRQEAYDQAQQEIEQALVSDEAQEGLDQHNYYNLGNTFFQAQQYETAIEAYKEALRLDPGDLEAKQNLELALRQLQQQQQEQQQNQQQQEQQQDESQQDESQQDESQDEQSQDEQSQDQQQQDQEQQDQEQQDEEQQGQEQQDETQENQASGQPQQITGLTEEQAEQLFEAAAQDTESLEEHLQQIMVFPWAPSAEDW